MLTYAVELSAPAQTRRLMQHFPDDVASLNPHEPGVEVLILKVNPVPDTTQSATESLIRTLDERGECEGLRRVQSIVMGGGGD